MEMEKLKRKEGETSYQAIYGRCLYWKLPENVTPRFALQTTFELPSPRL